MSKFRVVRLTQEALRVQCKDDDYEQWGAATMNLAQYQRRSELKRATAFSQQGSIYWALVETSDVEGDSTSDSDLVSGQTLLCCHCESHRFDCVMRRSPGEVERGYSYHIGTVFTLPAFRKRGLAALFLTEVAKQLAQLPDALVSVLYSDIGPNFYDKLGWRPHPSQMATLDVIHPRNLETGDSSNKNLSPLYLNDEFDALLKADNTRLVDELSSSRLEGREAFVMLPTRDSTEWQFCMGVHFAEAQKFDELPSCCGVKISDDAFIVWCHNYFKEPTLFIVRARFPDTGDDAIATTRVLLQAALEEARKFKLKKIAIWDPPSILLHEDVRRHLEIEFIEREHSLSKQQQSETYRNKTSDSNSSTSAPLQALEPPSYLVEHTDAMTGFCPPKYLDASLIKNRPIPTNNWWGNIIAHDSNTAIQPVWSNPYSLQMVVDKAPFGMSVSYPYRSRFFGGNSGNNGAAKFYAHGQVREFLFSAEEVVWQKPNFQVVDWADQGVTVKFSSSSGGTMVSDLVSGMVYASTKYSGLTPRLVSNTAISSVNGQPLSGQVHGSKFVIVYNSGQKWVVYALSSDGRTEKELTLVADGNSALKSTGAFDGILRVALVLEDSWVTTLDQYKSCIVQAANIELHDDSSYAFKWKTTGDCSSGLLHFAMVHHTQSIDTSSGVHQVQGMIAYSTTRGAYQAYATPSGSSDPVWELKETQEVPVDFYPSRKISSAVVQQQNILDILRSDINSGWSIPLDGSYYFNGKAAQKYASLCLIANDPAIVGGDKSLLNTCLEKLRRVMAPFVTNSWTNKLQYDQIYGGIVSSQGFKTKDQNADFGNTMYNDHHFHYGYWVHAAAIINRLDPNWSELGKLNTMVNLLVRDVANFDAEDKFFTRFRSFDWFRGHSYSHGVTPFADGKDQESTSEDVNFAFGMYMYGKATSNSAMEAVGKLMTRVNTHAIKTYFLIEDASQVHPEKFRPNKVTGIFFDNKVDYATWFSAEKYCIHGIQMIPVSAVTEFVRTKQFVQQEWNQVLGKETIVTREDTGNAWLSLLYANFAIVDKQRAMGVLQKAKMDDGLSRSWALYMAASFA
ncbi:hypothetical protein BBO99_00007871 [Phytophthora kernoviae]|uniref:glucan endo-1,3-beta-D-glucosidase n=1 Tax=Phytophthora kernoviae TaxID=325452 RepID=A0A3R7KQY3_9STRA|nr:hypothetical protein JM16_008699 [Phytophthora kernoviae]KAG2517398.1 hypothetical protein JM18_007198 [Phytophthora kernoviae]RLN14097.1 hypothetical protein BBI17_007813 [Phytophthora kernoviae]RLN76036.1 hypothetical protein BBO99_00007871 [Phytophthora kernoviae]